MNHGGKTCTALAALAFGLSALTACSADTTPDAADLAATRGERIAAAYEEATANRSTPAPTPYTKPQSALIPGCGIVATFSAYSLDDEQTWVAEVIGLPRDRGPREGATGEVTLDENGHPIAYAIAEGDMMHSISHRLCFEVVGLAQLNHVWLSDPIHPGQVLLLTPDPTTPWEPYRP